LQRRFNVRIVPMLQSPDRKPKTGRKRDVIHTQHFRQRYRAFLREQGQGPLVVLCHGWPEPSCSWRHQISAITGAGFHVVAPDMPRPTQGNAALIEFLRG
jgi:pimeloyl-ACP methyl ester carboxylesterase